MPLPTSIPKVCADSDVRSGGVGGVGGEHGQLAADGTAGGKKRKFAAFDDDNRNLSEAILCGFCTEPFSSALPSPFPPGVVEGWQRGNVVSPDQVLVCHNQTQQSLRQHQNDAASEHDASFDAWDDESGQVGQNEKPGEVQQRLHQAVQHRLHQAAQQQWAFQQRLHQAVQQHLHQAAQQQWAFQQRLHQAAQQQLAFQQHLHQAAQQQWAVQQHLHQAVQPHHLLPAGRATVDEQQLLRSFFGGNKSRRELPLSPDDILNDWLLEHFNHPYPATDDLEMWMKMFGYSRHRLKKWFAAARNKIVYHKKNIPKYLERNAKRAELEEQKAKAAAEKKADRDAKRDAKRAELEEQKAKAAAEKKADRDAKRDAKRAELKEQKAKAAAEKKADRDAKRDAKRAELEEQKAKAAAERDAKRAELEEQKAKAAAERDAKKAVKDAKRLADAAKKNPRPVAGKVLEKEILQLRKWLGLELVGLDEVMVAARLRKCINTKQKEVLDQIIPLWMKNDEDSKAKVNELLMSLKRGSLSMKKEHIVRYVRLKVYDEISLIKPFSTDPHIEGIKRRVHRIMKWRGDSYVIWGPSAPRTRPTKDEFIKKSFKITRDMEVTKRFADKLYIS